jgi:hypothetical protein
MSIQTEHTGTDFTARELAAAKTLNAVEDSMDAITAVLKGVRQSVAAVLQENQRSRDAQQRRLTEAQRWLRKNPDA